MKKVKFTLGLALSMLFAGASVSNAAGEYRPDLGLHPEADKTAAITTTRLSINSSVSEYIAKDTKIEQGFFYYKEGKNVLDGRAGYNPQSYSNWGSYAVGPYPGANTPQYHNWNPWSYRELYGIENGTFNSWNSSKESPNPNNFYGATKVYNRIRIPLAYFNGNEVKPVIKRVVTLGYWTAERISSSNSTLVNTLKKSDVVLPDFYLMADSADVRPYMDRESDVVAVYVFNDDILELINKHVIYSIHYEVSVRDEVASGGRDGEPQPPVYTDTKTLRGLKLNAQAGISTNPSTVGNILYVPSAKDYTFTVTSAKPITVTSNHAQYSESNNRIKVANNYDGTYSVTIRTVQANLELNIEAVGTTSEHGNGTTAVEAVADDAVWAAGGVLYVKSANAGSVAIYSLTGQLYQQGPVSGSFSATLPKGIYIVQLNGKAYKVVL